jgi:hypothetical protein
MKLHETYEAYAVAGIGDDACRVFSRYSDGEIRTFPSRDDAESASDAEYRPHFKWKPVKVRVTVEEL